jgi:hypothetical protein
MKARISAGMSPLVPAIAPVACIDCGKPAHLVRRTPDAQRGPRTEQQIFECSVCLALTTMAVER